MNQTRDFEATTLGFSLLDKPDYKYYIKIEEFQLHGFTKRPNWFWRLTQKYILGLEWKNEPGKGAKDQLSSAGQREVDELRSSWLSSNRENELLRESLKEAFGGVDYAISWIPNETRVKKHLVLLADKLLAKHGELK